MAGQIIIADFSASDKVPGFYGETKYGVGGTSAAQIPLVLLLVGLKISAGSATADSDIVDVLSPADADSLLGAGSELARMCYAALRTPGVTVKAAPVAAAQGAVAASATITIAGTWTTAGTWSCRIAGQTISVTVGATDTVTQVGTAIKNAINAYSRLPISADSSAGVVTVTCKTAGVRGNQHIIFQTTTQLPSGCTSTLAGGTAVNGGGVPLTSGSGADSATTLLGILYSSGYDRIALAQNDSTNLGLWKAQLAAQAGATENKLQHAIFATNGTLAAANSLSNTTVNDQRFQQLWFKSSETHPSEIAAAFAAQRTAAEALDPAASYDDVIVLGVAPQAARADWPSHSTLVSALNNGVTPLYTSEDGYAKICRSITTRCLSGTTPDYSTLDTSDAYVPDFVRRTLAQKWTVVKAQNPRVGPDAATNERRAASGVLTPSVWNSTAYATLKDLEEGKTGGVQVAPVVLSVDANLPVSVYDSAKKCIMSAVTVVPAPANHQIGVSVRQA